MNLVPVEKRIALREEDGSLTAAHNRRLWVLARGDDPDRTIPVNAGIPDLSAETVLPIYADPDGLVELAAPVFSDSAGRFPYWHQSDSVDYYSPDDPLNPVEPVEKPPGWAFADDGVRGGKYVRPDDPLPNPGDIMFGHPVAPGPDGKRAALCGFWVDSSASKGRMQGTMWVPEAGDPPEINAGRYPGYAQAVERGQPAVGATTILAEDALAGANELLVTRADNLPLAVEERHHLLYTNPMPLKVGDQEFTYRDQRNITGAACGTHPIGSTEVLFAPPAGVNDLPAAGRARYEGTTEFRWAGRVVEFTGIVDGDHSAGDSTLALVSVAGLPPAGVVWVATVEGNRQHKYTSIVGNVLQLQTNSWLQLAVDDGAEVKVEKLTGVTGERETAAVGDHAAGSTTLKVADITGIPASGVARAYTRVEVAPVPDLVLDFPIEQLPYDSVTPDATGTGGTLHLTGSLPAQVRNNYDVWIEGVEGLTLEMLDGRAIVCHVLTGVRGLDAPASAGEIVQHDRRYGGALRGNSGIRFDKATGWNPAGAGFQAFSVLTYSTIREDARKGHWGGAWAVKVSTMGPNSSQRDMLVVTDISVGIPGGDLTAFDHFEYPLHVDGPPQVRVLRPGGELAEDEEGEPDEVPPGQFGGPTVFFTSTRGLPESGQLDITAFNNVSRASEPIVLGWSTRVGVTQLDGPVTLPAPTIDVISTDGLSDFGFVFIDDGGDGQWVAYGAKDDVNDQLLECEGGEGLIASGATVTQDDNVGLRGVTLVEGSGVLGDYWLGAGKRGRLADDVEFYNVASTRGTIWDEGLPTEGRAGVYGLWLSEIVTPPAPDATHGRMYPKDVEGRTKYHQQDATSEERLLDTGDLALTPPPVNRQVFTTPGADTWEKPTAPDGFADHTEVTVEVIGGGGGGGSGRKGIAGSNRSGGGGGAGGAYSRRILPIDACGPTEAVTVGAGGAGAPAATADGSNGSGGSNGGTSQFGGAGGAGAGVDTRAIGGLGGAGGGAAAGASGGSAGPTRALIVGQAGGASAFGTAPAVAAAPGYARGGAGGGGIDAANAVGNGAIGGGTNVNNVDGGSAGTGGAAGGNGNLSTAGAIGGGGGGGGGGASRIANAGAGGNGGAYGGGGGGGGAGENGVANSGAGGNGAPGIVVVTTR